MILKCFPNSTLTISRIRLFSARTESRHNSIKQILEVSPDLSPPPKRPKRPNIHEDYLRRPLYGLATKGSKVFRETNNIVILLASFQGIAFLCFIVYKYLKINYFASSEEKKRIEKVRSESQFNPEFRKQYNEWTSSLDESNLLHKAEHVSLKGMFKGRLSEKKEDDEFKKPFNIIKQEEVFPRSLIERSSEQRKTLKDFDEKLR